MAAWDEALTHVLNEHGGALHAYGRILTGSRADGEDLVHDAIVRVFSRMRARGAKTGPPTELGEAGLSGVTADSLPSAIAAYLRAAMLTIYIDESRRRARWRAIRFRAAAPEAVPDASSDIDTKDEITLALATLSPTQRACVLLRYYDDLTAAQTARALGLALGTVKRHLHDAMARLRIAVPDGRDQDLIGGHHDTQ